MGAEKPAAETENELKVETQVVAIHRSEGWGLRDDAAVKKIEVWSYPTSTYAPSRAGRLTEGRRTNHHRGSMGEGSKQVWSHLTSGGSIMMMVAPTSWTSNRLVA